MITDKGEIYLISMGKNWDKCNFFRKKVQFLRFLFAIAKWKLIWTKIYGCDWSCFCVWVSVGLRFWNFPWVQTTELDKLFALRYCLSASYSSAAVFGIWGLFQVSFLFVRSFFFNILGLSFFIYFLTFLCCFLFGSIFLQIIIPLIELHFGILLSDVIWCGN